MADYLRLQGYRTGVYTAMEVIYTEYGEYMGNERRDWVSSPRSWPSGTRSPYTIMLTAFPGPVDLLEQAAWRDWWFGVQSPMSEMMQPRARYVRNEVTGHHPRERGPSDIISHQLRVPPYAGIVAESWPSARHMTDKYLFFGANTTWELLINVCVMLRSVTHFLALTATESVVMSEYIFD